MTQKEVHNAIVLNTTPEQKLQIAMVCAMRGVKIQDIEQIIAKVVTDMGRFVKQQDMEYLNKFIM